MKICIHAGHNKPGAIACGAVGLIDESKEARLVVTEMSRLLKNTGHTVIDTTVNDGKSVNDVLKKIVSKTNDCMADLNISIHFNAGAKDTKGNKRSTGFEVLATEFSGIKKTIGDKMCKNVEKLGFKNRGLKVRDNLYFLNKTKTKSLLVECCFVDDKDDVELYNYKTMAKALVDAINNVDTDKPNSDSNVMYRVICGSFKEKANAEKQIEKLKAQGLSGAFIEVKRG